MNESRWGHAEVQVDDSANDQRVEHLFEQSTCVQVSVLFWAAMINQLVANSLSNHQLF